MATPIEQRTHERIRNTLGDLVIDNARLAAENEALKADNAALIAKVAELDTAAKPPGGSTH